MKKLLASLEKAGRLAEDCTVVALLGTMVVLAVAQIVNREIFGGALQISWSDELVRIIVLWLAMVGSIAAARDNKHIRIDAIAHLLSGTAVRWIRVVVDLFAAAVCAFIGYHAWRLVAMEREWGDMAAIDVPLWLLHTVVPAAFVLISYRFLIQVVSELIALVGGDSEEAAA